MSVSSGYFECTLVGSPARVDFSIHPNYAMYIKLRWMGEQTPFQITKWSGQDETMFYQLFLYEFQNRGLFGQVNTETGLVEFANDAKTSCKQKRCIYYYAVVDIFRCLDSILKEHGQNALEYAVHHTKKKVFYVNYTNYIHLIVCNMLLESQFTVPNIGFLPICFDVRFQTDQLSKIRVLDKK